MRVLFLNPGGRAQGGAERSLAELISGLADHGIEPFVYLLADGDVRQLFERAGATIVGANTADLAVANRHQSVVRFATGAIRALPRIRRTGRHIRTLAAEHNIDLIHSNGFRAHVLTPLYASAAPVVWSLRDRAPRRLHRVLLRLASLRTRLVIANSRFTAEQLRRGVAVEVVANPVRSPRPRDRQNARRVLGLPKDAPTVAVLAHLHHSKGHDTAIDAISRLDDVHLAIAGGSLYTESDDYATELRAQIQRLDLGERVHLVGNLDDVADLYAAADVVLHPCRYPEGFGRVIVEGQLSSTPVVATGLGGVLDLIDHRTTGLIVPPDDADAMADAVQVLLQDVALRQRCIDSGRLAGGRFAPAAHVERVAGLYRRVAGVAPAQPVERRAVG